MTSGPCQAIEKSGNFIGCPIGVLAVREVTDVRKRRQIKIGEGFAEPIGPLVRKQWVVLCPPHVGGADNRGRMINGVFFGHYYLVTGADIVDFSCGDWREMNSHIAANDSIHRRRHAEMGERGEVRAYQARLMTRHGRCPRFLTRAADVTPERGQA